MHCLLPFSVGHKSPLFLALNGMELAADDEDCLLTMLAVASGELSEEELELWFQKHSVLHPIQA